MREADGDCLSRSAETEAGAFGLVEAVLFTARRLDRSVKATAAARTTKGDKPSTWGAYGYLKGAGYEVAAWRSSLH